MELNREQARQLARKIRKECADIFKKAEDEHNEKLKKLIAEKQEKIKQTDGYKKTLELCKELRETKWGRFSPYTKYSRNLEAFDEKVIEGVANMHAHDLAYLSLPSPRYHLDEVEDEDTNWPSITNTVLRISIDCSSSEEITEKVRSYYLKQLK